MPESGLTVAVTGPTGDIGRAFLRALDRARTVERVIGMARRPFDPAELGLKKVSYRRGDVLDRASVDALVKGADVVVHLAFIILGGHDETREINLRGSRNVFEATVAAGVPRLVYASSVAAYGFHADNPQPLTEDIPPRGTDAFYYSAQKAELEGTLDEVLAGSKTKAWVFRPCIVAGPDATTFIDQIPYVQMGERMPGAVRRLFEIMPILKPVIPDPGVPFQFVHSEDVATALRAGVQGKGEPGIYNLAGDGKLTMSALADEFGWYSVPLPELAVGAAAEAVARLPFLPAEAEWLNSFRVPVVMDTSKARKQLGWKPQHNARNTLRATIAAARQRNLISS